MICFELYHYNDLHTCQILRLHIEHVDGNSFCLFLFLDTGRLRPELVSKGFWRFVPKGSNWTRATLSALLFCTMFAGASVALLCFLWVAGVGGEWMEIDGWTYILPKAFLCSVECVLVFTVSYVVALSRCARSQRNATLQRLRDGAVLCTKIINWLQMLMAGKQWKIKKKKKKKEE